MPKSKIKIFVTQITICGFVITRRVNSHATSFAITYILTRKKRCFFCFQLKNTWLFISEATAHILDETCPKSNVPAKNADDVQLRSREKIFIKLFFLLSLYYCVHSRRFQTFCAARVAVYVGISLFRSGWVHRTHFNQAFRHLRFHDWSTMLDIRCFTVRLI